jgi:hypothetical protein
MNQATKRTKQMIFVNKKPKYRLTRENRVYTIELMYRLGENLY